MNGFVFRLPLLCLVQMGLVACGAAGETPMHGTDGTSPSGMADGASDGPLLLGMPTANADESGNSGDDSDDDAGESGDDGDHGTPTPGVDVTVGAQGITVRVALPDGNAITVATRTGTCSTTGTGVDIEGDVTIDLGSGLPLPLADADLHIEMGRGMPTLSGTANVSGSLLDGIGCGCTHDLLPAAISLDADATMEPQGARNDVAIAMNLSMHDIVVDAGALPLGLDAVVLGDADVTIKSDGEHRWLSIAGQVTADAEIWASTVPLQAKSGLSAEATVSDGALLRLRLQGSINLEGGKLWSGLTPLRELTMPEAQVTLDQGGLWLHATAQASAHPGFSVTGNALVDARFTSEAWTFMVCADVMTDIISASVKVGQCVGMTPGGSEVCDCHRDDDGHCNGGGV
jgi:hypothetical protein